MKGKTILGIVSLGVLAFFIFKGIQRTLNPGHLIVSLEAINSSLPTENKINQHTIGVGFDSFVFDGENFIHHQLPIRPPQQMSISVWVKPSPQRGLMPDTVIIRKGEYEFALTRDEREASQLWAYANGVGSVTKSNDLKIGFWNHVVLRYDGKQIVLFVNGKDVMRREYSDRNSIVGSDLYIGGDGRQNFQGEIARLKVFDRSLTKIQVGLLRGLESFLMVPGWSIMLIGGVLIFLFWLSQRSIVWAVGSSSVLFYLTHVWFSFRTLAAPSDPLQYVGSAVWKTTYGYWPWLDRIVLANNLFVFCEIFPPIYAGPIYILLVNTSLLAMCLWWASRSSGVWATIIVGLFFNTTYLTLGWSTYVYPDQTVALFGLASFICLSASFERDNARVLIFLAGFFSAWATFSKATGIASILFSIGFLIFKKETRWIIRYIIGFMVGVLCALGIFIILYNWESLVNVCYLFFKSSINENLKTAGKPINNYFDLIMNSKYYPMLALIALLGAYRNVITNYLFTISWVYLLFLCVIRLGGPPIPNYFYPAFVFCLLGTAIYLGEVAHERLAKSEIFNRPFLFLMAGFLVIVFAFSYARIYPPVSQFSYDYNYFLVQDVYSEAFPYPIGVKLLYSWGPAFLIGFFILIEIFSSATIFAAGFGLIVFFMAFLNGGLAYKKTAFDRNEAQPYYSLISIFNRLPHKMFGVFIENSQGMKMDRIPWVYRVFFDGKFHRKETFDGQIENEKEVNASIIILKDRETAHNFTGRYILTDKPEYFSMGSLNYVSLSNYQWDDTLLTLIEKKE